MVVRVAELLTAPSDTIEMFPAVFSPWSLYFACDTKE
jgi:hypothetical protein